jgi:hypothetical protein
MWAMMPMLRVRLSGTCLGMSFQLSALSDQLRELSAVPLLPAAEIAVLS